MSTGHRFRYPPQPHRQDFPPGLLALAGLALLCVVTAGCTTHAPPRLSHAPTYSYHHDPDARLSVERWAAVSEIAAGISSSIAATSGPHPPPRQQP